MASELITKEDLRHAKEDLATVSQVVNGEGLVTSRLGRIIKAFATVIEETETAFTLAEEDKEQRFLENQQQRAIEYQDFLLSQGYQELGVYTAGLTIENINQVVTVGEYSYRLSPSIPRPYITTGDWDQQRIDFIQINFITAKAFEKEKLAYQAADANLQAQISGGAPLEASAFSTISWHDQVVQNSVIIPPDKNAWSFGPTVTIPEGVTVTVSEGSEWTIANGERINE